MLTANENPGALAGASGAEKSELSFEVEYYRNRILHAMVLRRAIEDCHPQDAIKIASEYLADRSAGMPVAPLLGVMDEASAWADYATQDEAKAYALASYNRLTPLNQAAFLDHLQGSAAA